MGRDFESVYPKPAVSPRAAGIARATNERFTVKVLARVISVACIFLGLFLVTRTFVLEARYASTMPHEKDATTARTIPMVVAHETRVFVTDTEAKVLDTAQTYFTFGWPFVVLGVLLAAASRERKPPFETPPESDTPWRAGR
jgi:hypothetical protein